MAIVEAMERIEQVMGSLNIVRKMFALDHMPGLQFVPQESGDRKGHGPWSSTILPGGGGAATYSAFGDSGYLDVNQDANAGVIIHELGHRLDHVAGGLTGHYWSSYSRGTDSRTPWMIAACWTSLTEISEIGKQGAVSAYAWGGLYGAHAEGARKYYWEHYDEMRASGYKTVDAFVDVATRDWQNNRLGPGAPAEDFAETFAWYILGGDFVGAGGVGNSANTHEGAPNQERRDELNKLLDQFR